jgi:Holliday junction DNA helicase RuvA
MNAVIAYLKGNLEYILQDYIVVDVGNIGYQVFVSPYTITQLPQQGEMVKIHTYMAVREDGISLYGFLSLDEMDMFNKLITVSGIGPKVALGVLSAMRPQDISMAIIIEDINALSKAPGIGKKTAQRIILDLKDKLKTHSAFESNDKMESSTVKVSSQPRQEAIEALMSLGYSQMEATKAVVNIYAEDMSTETAIKLALKKLAKI